ncbi:MAG: LamG-like jellyroll fold domain-containing protein [Bacteroidia bacterium]
MINLQGKQNQKTRFELLALFLFVWLIPLPTWAQSGEALDFANENDLVNIGDMGTVNDWTVELWFKPTAANSDAQRLFQSNYSPSGSNEGVSLEITGPPANATYGSLYISVSSSTGFNPFVIKDANNHPTADWHHVAIVGDKTNNIVKVYYDGVEEVNTTNTSWPADFDNFVLGRGVNTQSFRDYDGQIDEFRVWDYARTSAEILADKDQELAGSESGLMAYYNFNQGVAGGNNATETTLTDIAGNYDGTLNANFSLNGASSNWVGNGPTLGSGSGPSSVNNQLNFAQGDYVDVANPADFQVGATTDFTIEAIVKSTYDVANQTRCIFSKMVDNFDPNQAITGYQLWASNGKLTLEWANNGVAAQNISGTTIITDNQCHHVAVVVDRSAQNAKLYVDGVLEADVTHARYGIDIDNIAPVYIGRDRTGGGGFFWYGDMDEVSFFSEARSAADIAQSATNELSGSESNLVGYWKFNSGVDGADNTAVTTASDETGGNDGTLINFDLTGTQVVNNAPSGTVVIGTWKTAECGLTSPPVSTDLEFIVGTPTSGPNNTVLVPVTVENFNNIATYQGSITFDPAVLSFVSGSYPVAGLSNLFGAPGQGSIPSNTITFSWIDPAFATITLADGTTVMELTFTVNAGATTGTTSIDIDGSSTPLGHSNDVAATTLSVPTVVSGGVTIDADPPTVQTASIASDNAITSLAKAADVITLTFTTSEAPAVTPVVSILEGGAGAVTVSGSGTAWTATKTVASGGDGVVTFSIQVEDQYANSSTQTATTDASSVEVDTELPTIVCPGNIAQDSDATLCSAVVNWSAPAGADNRAGFSVAQTAGPAPGSVFNVSTTATTITYTVTDEAGNVAACDFTVLVSDNELPTVVTSNITVQLDALGNATITPADIENGSTDNCGVDPLGFSLDIDAFDCNDVGSPVTVTLTVTDVNNNPASATAVVTVEEVGVISIAGEARSAAGDLIPNVDFDANAYAALTQNGSSYDFDLAYCGTSDIGAAKTDAAVNGLNVQDAIDVVRHVLLIQPFSTPYQRIAADVNTSSNINVLDALGIIRRVIGITSFPNGSWTFIPDDHVFADPLNPWTFPTRRFYTNPTPQTGQDFIGVKYGDVNNSWDPLGARPATPTKVIQFVMDQVAAQSGDLVTIPVRVKDFTAISGYQFTLNWDPSVLQFESVSHQALEGIYNTDEAQNGNLSAAWLDLAGQAITLPDGELAFELTFRVVGQMGSQTTFQMTSSMTPSQAFAGDRSVLGVTTEANTLTVGSATAIDPSEMEGYQLGQNFPNPFTSSTAFEFSLGQSEEVSIEIYNLNGQVVRSFEGRYAAGDHSLEWNGTSANGAEVSQGIYFVRMKAGAYSSSIRVQKF